MLTIVVTGTELWDEKKQEFLSTKDRTLQLEHSLVSISKWESKWHKSYLSQDTKSEEELIDYIKCMTITQNVNSEVYLCLTEDHYKEINSYIDNPMSAVSFKKKQGKKGGLKNQGMITSEFIYYQMISLNIPFECQKWHLNRLLSLIELCNNKNQTPKKLSRNELLSRNASLNASRREQLKTKG